MHSIQPLLLILKPVSEEESQDQSLSSLGEGRRESLRDSLYTLWGDRTTAEAGESHHVESLKSYSVSLRDSRSQVSSAWERDAVSLSETVSLLSGGTGTLGDTEGVSWGQ